jgi:protein LSM12
MSSVSGMFLGTELVVHTTTGETYTGELFCHDVSESNTFVLRERVRNDRVNYHWLKCSAVKEMKVTGVPSSDTSESSTLPALEVSTMEAHEKKGVTLYSNTRQLVGVGVTQDAQDIFDSLAKTMPCTWSGDKIQCYRVTISPPYTVESCAGPDENELSRVRKVLEGERVKLDNRRKK